MQTGLGQKYLHHGTMLFSADLGLLSELLNPNKLKLESKGIASVISRVCNLTETFPHLNHEVFCDSLTHVFQAQYDCPGVEEISEESALDPRVQLKFEELKSWQWLYGECPEFKYTIEKKFTWGLLTLTYNVEEGLIKEVEIYSDALDTELVQLLKQSFRPKVVYSKSGFEDLRVRLLTQCNVQQEASVNEFVDWIVAEL